MRLFKQIKNRLTRLRHRKGHGVHSPYIYNIVREVFMSKMCGAKDNRLFESLSAIGVEKKQAAELQNLFSHCGYKTFAIDSRSDANLVICSDRCSATEAAEIVELAKRNSATVIILKTSGRESICQEIVQSHDSTTVDKRAYLLIFNNHLPKQHFVL